MKLRILGSGVAVLVPLFALSVARANPPGWWDEYSLLNGAGADNYAVANVGQLKHVARVAYDMLRQKAEADLWETPEGIALTVLVRSWYLDDDLLTPKIQGTQAYAVLNQGQLKFVARHFYDFLAQMAYDGPPLVYPQIYPWTSTADDDRNYSIVNLGQLKYVFSFDLNPDVGDGLMSGGDGETSGEGDSTGSGQSLSILSIQSIATTAVASTPEPTTSPPTANTRSPLQTSKIEYEYDKLGRIKTATSGGVTRQFSFDPEGNLESID
jgi:hypothetical protein